jgi:hypothetical protein
MAEKVETALNETRILVLVVQVLVGFQFQSAFTKGFERLPQSAQVWLVTGLAMQLVALALLLQPAAYHRIVDRGLLSERLCRLTTRVVGAVLILMTASLGIQFASVTGQIIGGAGAITGGALLGLLALFFWWGLEAAERRKRDGKSPPDSLSKDEENMKEDSPLPEKIKFALTETRVVLPGAQALLGFQFTCILSEPFSAMPGELKILHLVSLVLVAVTAILLMAPAAYHRIVEDGESTQPVLTFTGRMLLAAMATLALGIAGDVYVVTDRVFHSTAWSAAAALLTVAVSYGLWFGYTLVVRSQPGSRIQDRARAPSS